METRRQKAWVAAIEKEEKLRLKWFRKNEEKLMAVVEAPFQRKVPDEVKEELRETRKAYHLNKEFIPKPKTDEPDPPVVEPDAILHVMRPIDPETRNLLYSGTVQDGRVNYLNQRIKTIPEKRYYCPETTSFKYGWNMWDHAKTRVNHGFGRCQIIQQSFYRRRGAERDPDWYRYPAQLSPTICGC